MRNTSWLSAVSVILAQALSSQALAAEATPVQIDIPAQSLADSIQAIARQTNTNILVDPSLVQGRKAPAINQQMSLDQALGKLLEGTGLTSKFVDEKTVVVSVVRNTAGIADVRPLRLAQAQAPTSPAPTAQQPSPTGMDSLSGTIDEIVVTAQKREERLIEVPQSVTVISAEDFARNGIVQFRDFADSVPGLTLQTQGAGQTQISLRGVTAGTDVSSTVAIYVDEVPYGSSTQFALGRTLALDVGLFDVERVEVLRGPQGTLYGASTMGGLIKYVTKRPDASRFGVDTQVGVSDTREGGVSYNTSAAVNVPLVTDKSALRVSGFYSHDGGYIDNVALGREDVNRSDVYGGRADLSFAITDSLDLQIGAFLQNISRDGQATADYMRSGAPVSGELDQVRNIAEPFDQEFQLLSATVRYDMDGMSLISVSSYQSARTDTVYDFTPLYVPLLASLGRSYSAVGLRYPRVSTDKFTQELRLTGGNGAPLEWVLGAYYTDESSHNEQQMVLRDLAGQPAPNDVYIARRPSSYEEYAAFGDVTWHLTDRFDVTGGVRYARNEQDTSRVGSGLLVGSVPKRSSSENVATYLANARYRINDRATAYVRFATGYRPGGPNFSPLNPTTGQPVGPETFDADRLKSYEAGIRMESFDRRLFLDLAGYRIDWSNIQVASAFNGFVGTINIPGGATINGAELSVSARPVEGFTVATAVAFQDAKLSEAEPRLRAADGEGLPNVPDFTATLSTDYEIPVGNWSPTVGATVRYVDERKADFGTLAYRLPDYTALDLRAGLTLNSTRVQLYVRNLLDERGQLSTVNTAIQPGLLQPRTIGLVATTSF